MKFVLAVLFLAAAASAHPLFKQWTIQHKKAYTAEEYARREAIFTANVKTIAQLNNEHNDAQFGLNKFADLSPEEFRSLYMGYRPSNLPRGASVPVNDDIPTAFDWRDVTPKRVSEVKDQGGCGSCWAFSAVTYLEGLDSKTNPLRRLSEQQLVDCDKECLPDGSCDGGCNGGWMITADTYAIKEGMMLYKDYPYAGYDQKCKYVAAKAVAKFNGTALLLPKDAEAIRQRCFSDGPISIAVNANPMQFYISGVITKSCPGAESDLNHGVAIVGWGTDAKGVDYWIIRNSWGASWGEKGHCKISRADNLCGVNNDATVIDP